MLNSLCLFSHKTLNFFAGITNRPQLAFVNERITNGQNAVAQQFPYICSNHWILIGAGSHTCGSSVLTANTVLTAAHCFTELPGIGRIDIVCGIHLLNQQAGAQIHTITTRIIHPAYPGGVAPNDIALGRITGTLNFNAFVSPINLPPAGHIPVHGSQTTLAGWGSTSTTNTPSMPNNLQFAHKPAHSHESCCSLLQSVNPTFCDPLDPTNLCAGTGPTSACGGDSGGPLSQQIAGTWCQVGVVSWGITPCGTTVAPSVYVRVSAFIAWINQNL